MAETSREPAGAAALLIFARAPVKGRVKQRLASKVGADSALDFYKACCRHVIPPIVTTMRERGCHCFVVWTHDMRGGEERAQADMEAPMQQWMRDLGLAPHVGLLQQVASPDLGHRMRAALQAAAAKGFSKMVLIGTDIPDMTPPIVLTAFEALDTNKVVFGPAEDGGYYLIGIRGPEVEPALFQDIPWSTSSVLAKSVEAAATAGIQVAPSGTLPRLKDIDTLDDLCSWYSAARGAVGSKAWKSACSCGQNSVEEVSVTLKTPPHQEVSAALQNLHNVAQAIFEERSDLMDALADTGYTMNS